VWYFSDRDIFFMLEYRDMMPYGMFSSCKSVMDDRGIRDLVKFLILIIAYLAGLSSGRSALETMEWQKPKK
jgi:hypothetical protein